MHLEGRVTRVLAVGGTGRIGSVSSKLLARRELVSEICIAARDLRLAERIVGEIGSKASAVEVDAMDETRLASAAQGCDLIVNTAGPDFRTALPVARAAVAAGVHCCDIAADGPSLEKVLSLDAKAKEASVALVTGIGHTPGLSNLLMQHAANQLDRVADLQLCVWWDLSRERATLFGDPEEMRKTGRINASWQQVLAWVSGRVRTYRGGRLVDVDPFEHPKEIPLPGDGGAVTAIPIGSTEPITFPRRIRGLRSVSVLMALLPPQLNEILREQARLITEGKSDAAASTMVLLETIAADPDRWLERRPGIPSGFGMMASATGKKGGQKVRHTCWPAGPWESTVGPLTVAALRILRGKVSERGVLPPEAVFEPLRFLEEAARYGPSRPGPGRLLNESREILH
jgi:saccharopine dehydrogenase (NAD+, L-lysine-forming)